MQLDDGGVEWHEDEVGEGVVRRHDNERSVEQLASWQGGGVARRQAENGRERMRRKRAR